jgi:hypothetical protein
MDFENWFHELELYSFRSERFLDDFDHAIVTKEHDVMIRWLKAAYDAGYNDGVETSTGN